ncbi:MAG TPA: cytochrome C oxidase subunit IV family protein [Tepidisphaeraceae bacterium]|jgi:cytochrome c oxidase subunit 4
MASANPARIPEEPHDVSRPLPHHKVNYIAVFVTLVVLTLATVSVAMLNIHNELVKILLALFIASVKAAAVCIYFMHLKFEGKLIYFILIVPLLLCVLIICALIPDIVRGPAFNDIGGMFLKMLGK